MQAARLAKIGAYLFADLDRKKTELQTKGVDVINLGVGDPDLPTPDHIIEALAQAARNPETHRYPPYGGTRAYREAAADWYNRRFDVQLDPESEVLALIGSKEGLAHLPWAILNPGDVALIPDPGYPVYRSATILADAEPVPIPLEEERGFLPDLDAVPADVARRARLLFLNYPNNPTAATAPETFFEDVVRFAHDHGVFVAHDNSYSEIAYDGYRPASFLQVPGAKEVGIELHSLSKTFCMTGWRIGFAVGNAAMLAALGRMKTNIDSGIFAAVQHAGVAALRGPEAPLRERLAVYQRRRDRASAALREIGWAAPRPKATFYLWTPAPGDQTGAAFAADVLERTGVVVTPGLGYGRRGDHYVRISLTTPDARLDEALERLRRAFGVNRPTQHPTRHPTEVAPSPRSGD